jgi:hypothetical protein
MISIFFLAPGIRAEGNKKDSRNNGLAKTTAQRSTTYLNINQISTFFYNNGISDISALGNSGLFYPKGSGKTAVYTSGLLWGAKVAGETDPRIGGTAYRTGLVPGKVLPDGTADDPNLDKYRIYRVRPDVYPNGPEVDLLSAALDEGSSAAELRANYEDDWTNWPAVMGAPYFDGNGNGQYDNDPTTGDIPGVPGADQTLWYVTNDLNSGQTQYLYGANPLGIEMQATIWAYNRTGALGSMYFRKYKIINVTDRSTLVPTTFQDMYVSMFSDVDDGDAGDDFVGVDTTLSLQFTYNATPTDAVYSPLPPPAVGFDFFQGPLVTGVAGEDKNKNGIDDAQDYGFFNGEKVGPGLINLPMTAAYYYANGDDNIGDPPQGEIQGSREFYNFIRGKFGVSGETFTDLSTGLPTTYALNGDPATGTGWLDGIQLPAGDRRMGSASGPFFMAPGDTQEVVVAEMVAGAVPNVNNISAIGLLKYYDGLAQLTYDNSFLLPDVPNPPEVIALELPSQINLDWGENLENVNATESYNIMYNGKNYKFQGYNIYQLPSASATKEQGKRIATFDIQDNFLVILGKTFDPNSGQIVLLPEQLGNNSGVSHYFEIKTDQLKGGTPLLNGIKYYFAVTAYGVLEDYDKDVPIDNFPLITNVENVLNVMTVVPHIENPEEVSVPTGAYTAVTHSGIAGGSVNPYIINPLALTGHDYEVYFTQRQEVLDFYGDWVPAGVETKLNKPSDLTGTSISIGAAWGNVASEVKLNFSLDLVSPTNAWADGITITLPAGMAIVDAPSFNAGGGLIVPEVSGNVIKMGLTNGELTQNGIFHGGETWSIIVNTFTPPIDIDWRVFDDGYTDPAGPIVDATGTVNITLIGELRTAKYWNLKDVTTGVVKLANQSVVGGVNLFPARDDIPANLLTAIPDYLQPQVDGFRIGVAIGYEAPTTISQSNPPTVNGVDLALSGVRWSDANYILTDFTNFGYADATASTTLPLYNGVAGTLDVNQLKQDYEIRWTGVVGDTTINGVTITVTKSGGSYITLFGASGKSIANHPLNPNPGSTTPFTVRVPFEIWNMDSNQEITALFWDRTPSFDANGGSVWNQGVREYLWVVNTPQSNTPIDPTSQIAADYATWNWVLYKSFFELGDIMKINYDNPIQIGIDTWSFNLSAATFANVDKAKSEINKINVFPNPYYGVNSEELNKYNRFVTFSHLPAKATVRIFNLAGVLVKTIEKDDPNQFLRWNLQNNSGLPVASGLYIAYIELPDLGETKILKVAIIQEQQILDRF